tara:strand:+ start:971 stop:1366 length:396 start_codon:yes stop_codon:yes gene_type:complete
MATKVSADVANQVDITARRGDSFYLKIVLTNQDGSVYNLVDSANDDYQADMKIYNTNDQELIGLTSKSSASSPEIANTITVTSSTGELVVETTANNMNLFAASYKYKVYVSSSTDNETNTVLVGKFKVIDL